MTTDDFIDLLQQQRLIPSSVASQLRAKAAQGDSRITPQSILKYLVKKEIVSRAQAKEILATTLTVSDKAESSILGITPFVPPAPILLTPIEDEISVGSGDGTLNAVSDELDLPTTLHDDGEVEPLPKQSAPRSAPGSKLRPQSKLKPTSRLATKKKKKEKSKDEHKSQWDSPLLLIGGGVLAAMIVGSGVLYWLLFRETADKSLRKAQAAFDQGNYQQATELYREFVNNFFNHKDYSEAKVRVGMSQLWKEAESHNFAGAADSAPTIIASIEDEPAFVSNAEQTNSITTAKQDLSSLLPRIAEGLAEQADQAADDETVTKRLDQARIVLELASNTKYIPEELRNPSRITAIEERLNLARSRLQRKTDLAAAVAKMNELVVAGKPADALKIRDDLLLMHSSLVDDPSLAETVLKIAAAEQGAVKFVASKASAVTTPLESPIVAELALAERRGVAAAGPAQPLVVRVDGGLYGLNSADGALRWRRFVGGNPTAYPTLLDNGRVVAADAMHNELICLDAETGQLVWRLPLEGKLASPVVAGDKLLVASDAGRLYVVKQADGELLGYVNFTQPLRVSPVVNERGDRVYALGEHSNLYVLSTDNFNCIGVYYLGHAAGGTATPPVVILNKVIVADNSGAETSRIRALALNEQGTPTAEAASFRVSGLVTTPLQVAGRRFAAVTSRGQAVIFEVAATNDKSALTALATRDAQGGEQFARFGLLHDGHLWLGARELSKLAILPTGNRLPVKSLDRDYRGDAFDYPLQAAGNLVIHVRRPAGLGGAIVAAMDAGTGKASWETAIAVPPAGAPAVDASSQQIVAGSSSGAVFLLDRQAMARRVQDQAIRSEIATVKPIVYADSLDLGGGRLALGGRGAAKILHFRPNDPRQQLREIALPGPLSSSLALWGDRFVAPTEVGQIFLYGSDDAALLATPFQPELTPGRKFNWLTPVAVGDGENAQLAVSDGNTKVYSLRVAVEPEPHLESTVMVDVGPAPLTTCLATAGATLFAGNEAGKVSRYALPDMVPGEPVDVGGHVAWGPFAVGEGVLLATDANELVFLNEAGAIVWRQPLTRGKLGGAPFVDGETAFLINLAGGVAGVSLADGAEKAFIELGQPVTAGPVAFGPRLIVVGADGALLVVNRP